MRLRKLASLLLVLCMVVGLIPATAMADEADTVIYEVGEIYGVPVPKAGEYLPEEWEISVDENEPYMSAKQYDEMLKEQGSGQGIGDLDGAIFKGTFENPEGRVTWPEEYCEEGSSYYFTYTIYAKKGYVFYQNLQDYVLPDRLHNQEHPISKVVVAEDGKSAKLYFEFRSLKKEGEKLKLEFSPMMPAGEQPVKTDIVVPVVITNKEMKDVDLSGYKVGVRGIVTLGGLMTQETVVPTGTVLKPGESCTVNVTFQERAFLDLYGKTITYSFSMSNPEGATAWNGYENTVTYTREGEREDWIEVSTDRTVYTKEEHEFTAKITNRYTEPLRFFLGQVAGFYRDGEDCNVSVVWKENENLETIDDGDIYSKVVNPGESIQVEGSFCLETDELFEGLSQDEVAKKEYTFDVGVEVLGTNDEWYGGSSAKVPEMKVIGGERPTDPSQGGDPSGDVTPEKKEAIGDVTLDGSNLGFEIGKKPGSVMLNGDEKYSIDFQGVRKNGDEALNWVEGELQAGVPYTYQIIIRPKVGYNFAPDSKLAVTGVDWKKTNCMASAFGRDDGRYDIEDTYYLVFEGEFVLEEPKQPTISFPDVHSNDWFYKEVSYVSERGIITGKKDSAGNVTYAPYENLARAQFAVILYRMAGQPHVEYTDKFPDVAAGIWYTDAIIWANQAGVVGGYANGYFGPADNITREQMATMMYRYANYMKYDTSVKTDFDKFKDAASVQSFAVDPMKWAVGNGIITGKDEGTRLAPQENASRAECAIIITRFLKLYEK